MNPPRYPRAKISLFGITSLHKHHPLMVVWWSAAFPGFGHFLLSYYLRATFLTLSEVIFNTLSHINEAIILSLCGRLEEARAIVEPRWILGYIIIFFIALWDSYRLAIYQNKLTDMAEYENSPLPHLQLFTSGIQHLQPKSPLTAAAFSLFFPGMGQFYNHRIGLAFYAVFWWWLYLTLSHAHESLIYILTGRIAESIPVLRMNWLLFMPSVLGGSVYHAYRIAKDHNQLYSRGQRQYLTDRYRFSGVQIFGKSGGHA